jgi:hypothetical protein
MRAGRRQNGPAGFRLPDPTLLGVGHAGKARQCSLWFWWRGRRGSVPPVTGAERGGQGSQGGKAVNQAGQASLHRGLLSLGWAGQRHL